MENPRADFRAWLRERLPEALIPSAFVVLDAFPLSTSGKIDRQALPAPERARGTDEDHVPPGDPLEEMLAGVWEELLGVDRVGVHDDFFTLGGHSLLATRVMSRVRDLFGVELPLRRLFAQPTVAALARLVREAQREGSSRGPAIVPVLRKDWPDGLPLSFAQQRLWFLEQLEPGNTAYHMPQAVRLTGRVSAKLLERIFAAIVARHEALRTTFVSRGEQPAQVIASAGERPPVLRVIDLSGLPEAEREERAHALARQEAARPFDLRTGPLMRQTLVRLAAEDHLLLLNLHHIVSDGWSMGVLIGEIAELYRAFSSGDEPRLPALPVQYADYAVWQRGWLQGEVLAAELAWWREQLAGLPPLLELPTDRPRPPVQSFRGGQLGLRLPADLSDRLRALAHREGATLFMALLAGFQALLARCSGQDQIAVGSPIAGRNHSEIESLIGFFVNTLVLRGDLSGTPGFRELVGRARERALGAYAHQEVPFEKLVEERAPERSLAHAPLFQVMLVLQNTGEQGIALEGLRLRPVDTGSAGAKFDLTLSFQEHGGEILGGLTYASDLFDAATLRRFLDRFERLLASALESPAMPWTELQLLAPAEVKQLAEWTDTVAPVSLEGLLHQRIAERAAAMPEADAVLAGDGRLGFRELDRRANQLARHLIALGVAPESRVALCMDRSVDLVVGLLAALKAGAAFVVVDPAQPLPRLSRVLRDAAPAAVLTREPACAGLPEDLPLPVVWLDRGAAAIAGESAEDPLIPVDPEQAAYVVYTSGSTGTPKGVVIRHGAVLNLLAALERTVYSDAPPWLRVSVNAPLYFDGAIKQVIQLAQGRTLCLVPDEVRADAAALGRYLAEQRVDVLDCTPAQLRALLDSEAPLPARLLVGGEAVDQALWDRLARLHGTASFNVYGPSECTVDTTARRIGPDAPRPVLGRPLVNVTTHVMSASLLPQPPGIPGELWIGGAGVARGYLGRPDLTAERFVPDPFATEPGARLYRTGDLVRWLPQGELEFLGRGDHQAKVRGFRIELGEIEAVLAGHPAVRDCAVLVREERSIEGERGDRRLVAWVALQENDPATAPMILAAWLRERLPAYMVPAGFGVLGELPLTPNGKVDRRALSSMSLESRANEDSYVPPADPVEEMLAGIWGEVLGVERVGSRDSFFELGGHSLLATRVTSRVRARLGVELPLRALFESPTLAD
ncbi:MAG TPA: amino acid adenylation domain-containing protein, partial [Thermoanaerobaculia bacterium]|nr:amino acid adenylation domain-containing protein [Thermoanaerobaculia bacterium]